MDKEQLAIARLQDAARLSEHRYKRPLMVTYSGGKDSQVLVALAERAGINFEVVNSHTTADAPETVYFIRDRFKELEERGIKCTIIMPTYKGKPVSMWTLIPQKLVPPTRIMRYCCAVLKETTGHNRFIATGVRWAESTQRKLNRGIMEINHRDKEIIRVFNGWLEEADSLAEREAIECCIDHIQDAPAVSQQELRSYMLPWFRPFAAPWCGKIQRAFPKAYVTMNFELILVPRTNTYINLNHCSTPDEFKAEVIEGVSRFAFKGFTKPLCREHLDGINKLLDSDFTPEEIEYIYTNLGNGINHELCMKFVQSGYDLGVIDEGLQAKDGQA